MHYIMQSPSSLEKAPNRKSGIKEKKSSKVNKFNYNSDECTIVRSKGPDYYIPIDKMYPYGH